MCCVLRETGAFATVLTRFNGFCVSAAYFNALLLRCCNAPQAILSLSIADSTMSVTVENAGLCYRPGRFLLLAVQKSVGCHERISVWGKILLPRVCVALVRRYFVDPIAYDQCDAHGVPPK